MTQGILLRIKLAERAASTVTYTVLAAGWQSEPQSGLAEEVVGTVGVDLESRAFVFRPAPSWEGFGFAENALRGLVPTGEEAGGAKALWEQCAEMPLTPWMYKLRTALAEAINEEPAKGEVLRFS